jgi:hypothetical protein
MEWIVAVRTTAPNTLLEAFIHKAERLQDEDKFGVSTLLISSILHTPYSILTLGVESITQIDGQIQDNLSDMGEEFRNLTLSYAMTSVYDHSLHAAFSKVLNKLVESVPHLESLLNSFCSVSLCDLIWEFVG